MLQVPILYTLKNYCEQYCERDATGKYVGSNVDNMLHVLDNSQKRNIDVQISPTDY